MYHTTYLGNLSIDDRERLAEERLTEFEERLLPATEGECCATCLFVTGNRTLYGPFCRLHAEYISNAEAVKCADVDPMTDTQLKGSI